MRTMEASPRQDTVSNAAKTLQVSTCCEQESLPNSVLTYFSDGIILGFSLKAP